jgi:hypothetical protein
MWQRHREHSKCFMRRDGPGGKGTRIVMGSAIYITCGCALVVVVNIGAVYAPTDGLCMTMDVLVVRVRRIVALFRPVVDL